MTFGERLRELRKRNGLTQPQLAKELNLSLRTIKNYELDTNLPKSREIYERIADYFSIDINYLLTDDEIFVLQANEKYGSRGRLQATELISQVSGLFAGGEMDEADMDEMMKAIQDAYWLAKEKNRKYTPKKYSKKGASDLAK